MKEKDKIKNLYHLCWHIVRINAPSNMPAQEKKEIATIVRLSLSPIASFITVNEASKIIARYTYAESKMRGFRKRKIGKKSVWHKEKHLFTENERT